MINNAPEQNTDRKISIEDVMLDFDGKYTRSEILFRLDALNTYPEISGDLASQRCLAKIRDVAEPASDDDIIHFVLDSETGVLYPVASSHLTIDLH